jgi:uncharacterized protein involved in response to NO
VLIAALLRIAAAFVPSMMLLEAAGVAWLFGFTLFVVCYGRLLALRKPAWAQEHA